MELNGIQFNNVKSDGGLFGVTPIMVNDGTGKALHGVDPEFGGIINAVEIDWKGASICNQTVNTTGQLLSN